MKKILSILLVLTLVICFSWAKDFKFFMNGLDQHPEILGGFLPTGSGIGMNYEGWSIKEGDLTQIQLKVAAGYLQRQIFQNWNDGDVIKSGDKVGIFDVMHVSFGTKFSQGFGQSWIPEKDLFTVYAGYDGKYEEYHDSLMLLEDGGGLPKKKDYKVNIGLREKEKPQKLDEFLGGKENRKTQKIYPELRGDNNLSNVFYTGITLNCMDDKMVSNEGLLVDFMAQYAPDFLNENIDYYTCQINAVAGTTLYEVKRPNGLNKFSIVVLDRANISWIDGNAVPTFASHSFSLGRKMRGFDNNSFNTNFALVNNFDIRFAGPEPIWDGVFARLNLFFDCGLYAGKYVNTGKNNIASQENSGYLASTGFQLELDFIDSIDLGLQVAYLLHGNSLRDPSSKTIVGATFFLDF